MLKFNTTQHYFNFRKSFFIIIALGITQFFHFASLMNVAKAQTATKQEFSLSVSPPVAYLYAKPSEKLRHTLIVKNDGQSSLRISINVTDFKADGTTGQPILQPGKVFNKEINPELSFGEPFTLAPGRSHSVNLQFDVSGLATEKEYPLAVLVNATYVDPAENNSAVQIINPKTTKAKIAGTVVSNMIVYIGQEDTNQGLLSLANINMPHLIDSFSGIKFELLAKNSGKTADVIEGRAIIKNIFKHTISEYIFYPDFVLANTTRMVRGTKSVPEIFDNEGFLNPEKVDTLTTQFFYKPPMMFGVYTIELELAEERYQETVVALPFSVLAAIGIGFLIFWTYSQIVKKIK